MMKIAKPYLFIGFLISTTTFLAESPASTPQTPAEFEQDVYEGVQILAQVLNTTRERHFKCPPARKILENAISGALSPLDPHSAYLNEKMMDALNVATSGEFFGIGVMIDNTRSTNDKALKILQVIPDGPADNAGLKGMDQLVEIDGKALEGMATEAATAALKGPRKTKVTVKVLRESVPDLLEFVITRDVVKEQSSICFYLPEYHIYYLSLTMFSDNAVKQLKALLQESQKKAAKSLVLDLRFNSGGLLTAAVDIAGLFLNKNSLIVTTKNKEDQEIERYETKEQPIANESLPIFILINNFTASAAEILAGCLKHYSNHPSKDKSQKPRKLMVFLVGTKSFGKGSVQEVIPLMNNCALKLTTSLYFLPDNTSLQGVGIEPDFVIEKKSPPSTQATWFAKSYGREKALENYIQVHHEEEPTTPPKKDPKEKNIAQQAIEALEADTQLRETITLSNLFHSARAQCSVDLSTREKALKFMKSIYVASEPIKFEEVKI